MTRTAQQVDFSRLDFRVNFPLKRALFRAARLGMPWRIRHESYRGPSAARGERNAQDEDQIGR